MLKFSEIFEFSKEKFQKIPILKEFESFEWFEWFGPSPIEPFNSGRDARDARRRRPVHHLGCLVQNLRLDGGAVSFFHATYLPTRFSQKMGSWVYVFK